MSGHSCAWRDGSAGCYPKTPIVVVVSGHVHAWRAGSDSLFETLVVVVVCGPARACGLLAKDVSASSMWWASVVLTMLAMGARPVDDKGVGACCVGDEGVGARCAGNEVGGVGRGLGGSQSSIALWYFPYSSMKKSN